MHCVCVTPTAGKVMDRPGSARDEEVGGVRFFSGMRKLLRTFSLN